MNTSNYY